MSDRAREWAFWAAVTILVAAVVHFGTLYAVPRIVMMRALTKLGRPNVMHFGKRPDATTRMIVRPSPDLLYATCPYDLSKGALRVIAPVTHANYWSVSAFDAATNNYFVRNDQKIAGDAIEILMLQHGQPWPPFDNALERIILFSPSTRGLILIRAVVDDDKHVAALQTMLHRTRCETVASANGVR